MVQMPGSSFDYNAASQARPTRRCEEGRVCPDLRRLSAESRLAPPRPAAAKVSILIPAYNAAAYLRQSVESILSQTFADFELIVVDDCSTDDTPQILDTFCDPRLRTIRNDVNRGVVATRNRAMDEARGEFVALLDADDISLPTRLARQVAFLKANPAVGLLGTASRYLEDGTLRPGRRLADPTPMLVRWLLHVTNPIVNSSILFRADAARRIGPLWREEFKYAEDFDFHHRMLQVTDAAFLDEPLTLYRRHAGAMTVKHEEQVMARAQAVLAMTYTRWFGAQAAEAAALVVTHVMARKPVEQTAKLRQLGEVMSHLTSSFLETYPVTEPDRAAIVRHGADMWRQAVLSATRGGHVDALMVPPPAFAGRVGLETIVEASKAVAIGFLPFKPALKSLRKRASRMAHGAPPSTEADLFGVSYAPIPEEPGRPPTLFVVVDTEAEFDWNEPFSRQQDTVQAMAMLHRGQEVFDRYGLRPIYVVDYPVASKPEGVEPLRAIHRRGGCEVGVHLHPWTTPPFEETLSTRNSFAGNLPAEMEERKLTNLLRAIRDNFEVAPRFFKAGRYGVGSNTMEIVARHGIEVDLSILPGRNLRAHGGPDFRDFDTAKRSLLGGQMVSLPMTRGCIGRLAFRSGTVPSFLASPILEALHVPGILARLGLLETVILTPEGESAANQVALIRTMLARGQSCFVLHYHSPSLAPGFTPYARTPAEANLIVERIAAVCRFFFEELGGVPGYPKDLLPPCPQRRRRELQLDPSTAAHG